MNAEGNRLTRTAIDLEPTQILVTAGCHFSVDAAEDISADPVLGPVFARNAHWLVSTPGIESIDAARAWNQRLPDAQVEMIPDRGECSTFPTRAAARRVGEEGIRKRRSSGCPCLSKKKNSQ